MPKYVGTDRVKCSQGAHGWCGTLPMNGDTKAIAKPTIDSGWGYCTDDCKGYCEIALSSTVNTNFYLSNNMSFEMEFS